MAKSSNGGENKAQRVAAAVQKAVRAGQFVQVPVVDFSDPNRPKTCLEVDFPILPINEISAIEGNAGKPIYQMSKWWARRRSSVFRSLLLSAAMKAPDDPGETAKAVWEAYYGNHQRNPAFRNLKVADIFMGGGTTIVEGSRLGMQMFGNDLNPVAWFVVKSELAQVKKEEVEALLADIEAEVKPQIMPFYACNGPHGEKGTWTRISDGKVMGDDFDPTQVKPEDRKQYKYDGPEIIYVFWGKHGPCQTTGCNHRTPIMSSAVIAERELSVNYWLHKCPSCKQTYHLEDCEARMSPDAMLICAPEEEAFATFEQAQGVVCPHCKQRESVDGLSKVIKRESKKKKVSLHMLVHPDWLGGESGNAPDGQTYGGCATDDASSTARWNRARAAKARLIEYRGENVPETLQVRGSKTKLNVADGTVPAKSTFACSKCGTHSDVLTAIKATQKTGPVAATAIQGFSRKLKNSGAAYGGRFFAAVDDSSSFDAANREWSVRKDTDLKDYWPRLPLPEFGFMTHMNNGGIPNHGYTHWWMMFNPRQLLVVSLLLRAINTVGGAKHSWATREYVLGVFQQYIRNQCMMSFWHRAKDHFAPALSNDNFHPKDGAIEVGVYTPIGYGPWTSTSRSLVECIEWSREPWEIAANSRLSLVSPTLADSLSGKGTKVPTGDPLTANARLLCGSATELSTIEDGSIDLVITDPPFGGLLHYSELSDFFYVWLALVLRPKYPDIFKGDYSPKTQEAVANRSRHQDEERPGEAADAHYKRLLTASWGEAFRILKPSGILSFTFHHKDDEPWVAVLDSLFEAGFCLEATYPIRSDETKGEGAKPGTFGSQMIEFDIIHVCRKRTEEPKPVSWAKMRREVLKDIEDLRRMLEHHKKEGLQDADLQVIRRGKALEYYSRHYGKVFVDESRMMGTEEALAGVNFLLSEQSDVEKKSPVPGQCDPLTAYMLRMFGKDTDIDRDQMQKYLRGSGLSPANFVDRGWCYDKKKHYHLTAPLEIAKRWVGKHRAGMVHDYDQAMFLIGAFQDGSGIDASQTLNNENFEPHEALEELLQWLENHGPKDWRKNAGDAVRLIRGWKARRPETKPKQGSLFGEA